MFTYIATLRKRKRRKRKNTNKVFHESKKKKTTYTRQLRKLILLFTASVPLVFLQFILLLDKALSIPQDRPHPECGHLANVQPDRVQYIPSTAYSSTVHQTDSTPFITADGTYVHWGVVAANFLPFGTCVRFPETFGDQFFVVHDRKHERFSESFDVWFPSRRDALDFGFRTLKTEIWYNE